MRARGQAGCLRMQSCRLHVVFIRLRVPGSWTQRLKKGVTKRCLALGIWYAYNSAKSTAEIGQLFLGTGATLSLSLCCSSGQVFNAALLRYRGEHAEYSTYVQHLAVAGCPLMEVAKEVFEIKRRSKRSSTLQGPSPHQG